MTDVSDPGLAISHRLNAIEAEHDVTVLYACESGSRAWGFASADSDYDVRFLYVHPRDWYLSIDLERRDDALDPPVDGDLDLHGWDLRKALRLLHSSNPTLLEWLRSPIVYREHAAVAGLHDLAAEYDTAQAAGYHYHHLARRIAQRSLADPPVSHKAYLYVLRALLAVRWVQAERGPVPVRFERLLEAGVDDAELRGAIDNLLSQKRAGTEQAEGPRLSTLHDFIDAELERLEGTQFSETSGATPVDPLNTFFRRVLARLCDDRGEAAES